MFGFVCGILFVFTTASEPDSRFLGAQNDSATIIVYRLKDFQGSSYTLKANQKIISRSFRMYQVVQFNVPAGEVIFETSGNISVEKKRFTKQVSEGKTYYLEAVVDYSYLSNALLLYQREDEVALEVVRRLKEGSKK